ncbi:MAG: RdgB/HAM1 family non-canonical purine NTP pyrophosphatase [Alphaproteobacteria bacterium]|nr:RdgB/HAM1 family non-canonical purine NTP pyrophosphatase [Alphaproteobacteria bacterium]
MQHKLFPHLIVATHNEGKVREFAALLHPYVEEIVSSGHLGLAAPEETGATFADNAIIKARAAALATGQLALADDSGLCVNALNGAPGVYSARWAEPGRDFTAAMRRIEKEIGDAADRSAHFICVLALCWPDGRCETVTGRVYGTIAREPRGANGHGYDPIFIPEGETRTFAEMSDAEKNALSHRAIALRDLADEYFKLHGS